MSLSVIDAIGIFGTVLGTVSFIQDNLPTVDPEGTTVKIKGTIMKLQIRTMLTTFEKLAFQS